MARSYLFSDLTHDEKVVILQNGTYCHLQKHAAEALREAHEFGQIYSVHPTNRRKEIYMYSQNDLREQEEELADLARPILLNQPLPPRTYRWQRLKERWKRRRGR
jgi:hypothetical protein